LNQIGDRLELGCMTVTGRTLGENIAGSDVVNTEVIRPNDNPSAEGFAALLGNSPPTAA
jgi:dihydroxy-acid dehydratase